MVITSMLYYYASFFLFFLIVHGKLPTLVNLLRIYQQMQTE